ncbi:YHS domain-containing protein [Conexibacter sp. W3-3-2]|uniref:adenylate/guanylate cyclase domain-containing protein n=1 Tax=Conexibacter sp. W3-3-2 TaxID=2675227 RepID=UPI0012B8CA1B|nr:adenylate/guanylate cyclase domain-containing protein [Conexibacter sp. W3-3-2]MTD47420.1 YHS domain-containing protein [Conexibacter sp. W3-3-2]MTD47559.1 YHS domain-containing protein [Conexibacter sp. W3-3-2]
MPAGTPDQRRRGDPAPPAGRAAFVFADLVGYTALTAHHGDELAADLALALADLARTVFRTATFVKTIGDAVMVRVPAANDAVDHALTLCEVVCARVDWPQLTTGIAYGTAAQRGTDYFGATVNRAARLCAHAQAGQVLVDQPLRDAVGRHDGILWEPGGEVVLRNLAEPVTVHQATWRRAAPRAVPAIDPVCRMRIDPATAIRSTHHGQELWFCSPECTARFHRSPEAFTKS